MKPVIWIAIFVLLVGCAARAEQHRVYPADTGKLFPSVEGTDFYIAPDKRVWWCPPEKRDLLQAHLAEAAKAIAAELAGVPVESANDDFLSANCTKIGSK